MQIYDKMCDDMSPVRPHTKTRSASICATSGSMEAAIYNSVSGTATPENGTPGYRRRRPATRSQSARITGARAAKKKAQQPPPQNLHDVRTHCNSEPRLNETETPPQRRKLSQRHRPPHQTQRKSNAFLDVPTLNMHHLQLSDPEDHDVDRLRTFNTSKGVIINRGDSFRRRRSRSNSLAPVNPVNLYQKAKEQNHSTNHVQVENYIVQMLGSVGVGKAALVEQFKTSDCINAYDGPETDEMEQTVSIILNGIESELKFLTEKTDKKEELAKAHAFLVVYSVIDKSSFTNAEKILSDLHEMELLRTRPVILVGNKIDLARSRAVSTQDGKCVACTFRAKFIEVSVGINHNCDELLAGTLTQIQLKKEHNLIQGSRENSASWYKSRGVVRASMKARQMITWILGKEDSKFRNCENLQVL
ncbi:hypothetical protein ACFFRR_008838 [Megaselia abdita]